MTTRQLYSPGVVSLCSALLITVACTLSHTVHAAGIIASVEKATVVADGNVTGRPGDYLITFDGSMDPNTSGRGLAAGDRIKIYFPRQFDLGSLNPAYPLRDVPAPPNCVPANLQCTTAVILQGWPEEPYFPPAAFHTLSIDAARNALVVTALRDIVPNPPSAPGIKQLFLMLHGVTNPRPGHYRIRVDAQTGPNGSWESGSAVLHILPSSKPSIAATSVLVKALSGQLPGGAACGPGTLPPNPDNPIYQRTGVNSPAPFPWTFLLWGRQNEAITDVTVDWVNRFHALLRRGRRVIGHVFIDAPRGATGYGIDVNPLACPTLLPGAPVIGGTPGIGPQPVGRLDMRFRVGNKPGAYTTTIFLKDGNSVEMVVEAE